MRGTSPLSSALLAPPLLPLPPRAICGTGGQRAFTSSNLNYGE